MGPPFTDFPSLPHGSFPLGSHPVFSLPGDPGAGDFIDAIGAINSVLNIAIGKVNSVSRTDIIGVNSVKD